MTAGPPEEVDHDLLADYVGGALDGLPEGDVVSRLVAENPAWGRAYAELVSATDLIRTDLATWGVTPVEMPADIADRIVAALAAEPPPAADARQPAQSTATSPAMSAVPAQSTTSPAAPAVPAQSTTSPAAPAVPAQASMPRGRRLAVAEPARGGRRATAGTRRWARLGAPVGVAALVTAFAAFGVSRLVSPDQAMDAGTGATVSGHSESHRNSPAAGSAASGGRPGAIVDPAGARVLRSGTNYTAGTLAATVSALRSGASGSTVGGTPVGSGPTGGGPTESGPVGAGPTEIGSAGSGQLARPDQHQTPTVPGLGGLSDRDQLARCLDAVAEAHDQGTVRVDLVDYASFEGKPAVVLDFVDAVGGRWVWVVGANCGSPGFGADDRHRRQVG